jgi:pilus assembly protein FimV
LRGQFRTCAIFISLLAVMAAPQSWGLGLGEIELDSALNQEFRGKIELIDVAGLEPGEILVSLGTAEDFQRIGVERFFFLTDLDFEVGYDSSGAPVINVTSSKPITEPYLNFLVEVLWPNGRLLKEFTVLLDPPTFSEAAAPQVSAPAQNTAAASTGRVQRVEPAPAASTGTRVQMTPTEAPAEPSPLDRGMSGGEYGMTDRDDTLWSIASRARPSSDVSVQQTMLAIQRMNPDAFINGNINLLKAGYVLRLPNEAEARALSAQEALGEVARHHSEWMSGKTGEAVARTQPVPAPAADQTSDLRSPVDASSSTAAATSAPATEGELRIVAEDGDSTTGVGGASNVALDAALEETDRLGRRVEELTYQLDREQELATNEIAIRERQLEVKDQQIAELQAQLAAARQQAQTASATPPPAPAPAADPAPEPQNQNQSTPAEATAPWWQSPIVMYGGAGVLVLLLVGGMMMARKRRAQEEENDYFDAEEAFAEEERHEPLLGEAEAEDDATVIAPFAQAQDDDGFDEALDEAQTSDVIGEADIYIAYGRYPQAVGLLTGVLEDEPDRNDVRLKLLEVYSETGERAEFDTHLAALNEYCTDEDALQTARDLESRFGEEPVSLDDMMSEVAAPPAEAPTADEVEDDATVFAGLSLDDDDTATREQPVAEAEVEATTEELDSALDFEL